MSASLDELLAFARDVARGAGALQLAGLSTQPQIDFKGRRELVTPVDHACEAYVIGRIQASYPEHGFFAEEGHSAPGSWRWIVDPIDGTTNFSQRLPAFCVSLALEDPDGVALGVVHAPYLGETFFGRRGGGAWFQRGEQPPRPARVSATAAVADAVLATGFAYVRNESPNHNLDNWRAVSMEARGLRRMGSAAIDLAYVADGRFDGFWEMHLKPYDVAAGALLIQEAGGRVTDMFGGDDWLEGQSIVATNGPVHEPLRALLAPVAPDPWIRRPGGA